MANRFTRIPEGPPPPLTGLGRATIPVADLFMRLLYSRPSTGSLAKTWVTPGTLQLSGVLLLIDCPLLALLGSRLSGPLLALLALLLVGLGVGAAAVAIVGLSQRSRSPKLP